MFLVILERMTKEQSACLICYKIKARSSEKVTDMSGLTVMIIGKRAFARIAFPLYVALVLVGYWSVVSCSFFAIHLFLELLASAVRFVFPGGDGVQASGLQLRRFIRTGDSLRKWRSLGRQYDQFQPSCDVTTYTIDSSAGKLKLRMRSQTRVLEDENATESEGVDAPVDASSFAGVFAGSSCPKVKDSPWGVLLGPGGCCCCVCGPCAFFVVVRFSLLRLGFFLVSTLCFKRMGGDPETDQLFLEDPADWHRPENRNSFRYPQRLRRTSTAKCSLKVSS